MKGQAFATMKMALGAVFAVALLTLVYFLTQNINPPTTAYSESSDMITQALNAPGKCIGRTLVTYKANEILTPKVYLPVDVTVSAPDRLMVSAFNKYDFGSGSLKCCSVVNSVKLPLSVNCTDVTLKKCDIYLGVPNCII